MTISVIAQYNGGFPRHFTVDPSPYFCMVRWQTSPRHYTVDPRLLQSGNPFYCHVEVLSLKPMKQYIFTTTTLFDDVLHCVLFLLFCLVSLHGDKCKRTI